MERTGWERGGTGYLYGVHAEMPRCRDAETENVERCRDACGRVRKAPEGPGKYVPPRDSQQNEVGRPSTT